MCSSFKNEVTSLSLCNDNRLNHALCDDNIDYYMVFFISHPLSALGHDISPIANRLKG
jgi:methylglyoxal synthase